MNPVNHRSHENNTPKALTVWASTQNMLTYIIIARSTQSSHARGMVSTYEALFTGLLCVWFGCWPQLVAIAAYTYVLVFMTHALSSVHYRLFSLPLSLCMWTWEILHRTQPPSPSPTASYDTTLAQCHTCQLSAQYSLLLYLFVHLASWLYL